jgi:hypothetical protein
VGDGAALASAHKAPSIHRLDLLLKLHLVFAPEFLRRDRLDCIDPAASYVHVIRNRILTPTRTGRYDTEKTMAAGSTPRPTPGPLREGPRLSLGWTFSLSQDARGRVVIMEG